MKYSNTVITVSACEKIRNEDDKWVTVEYADRHN